MIEIDDLYLLAVPNQHAQYNEEAERKEEEEAKEAELQRVVDAKKKELEKGKSCNINNYYFYFLI